MGSSNKTISYTIDIGADITKARQAAEQLQATFKKSFGEGSNKSMFNLFSGLEKALDTLERKGSQKITSIADAKALEKAKQDVVDYFAAIESEGKKIGNLGGTDFKKRLEGLGTQLANSTKAWKTFEDAQKSANKETEKQSSNIQKKIDDNKKLIQSMREVKAVQDVLNQELTSSKERATAARGRAARANMSSNFEKFQLSHAKSYAAKKEQEYQDFLTKNGITGKEKSDRTSLQTSYKFITPGEVNEAKKLLNYVTQIESAISKEEKKKVGEKDFTEIARLKTEREKAKQNADNYLKQHNMSRNAVGKLDEIAIGSHNAEVEKKVNETIAAAEGLKKVSDEAAKSAEEVQKRYSEAQKEVVEAQKEVTAAQKDVDTKQATYDNQTKQLESFSNELKKNREEINQSRQSLRKFVDEASSSRFDQLKEALRGIFGDEFVADMENSEEGLEKIKEKLDTVGDEKMDEARARIQEFLNAFKESESAGKSVKELGDKVNKASQDVQQLTDRQREVENFISRFKQFFSLTNGFMLLKRSIRDAINTIKELDAVMTQTAVVSENTVGDMWKTLPEYSKEAKKLGAAIKDVYSAQTLYVQQGLDMNSAMDLGVETLKMARVAGIDAAAATDTMTAALRGFKMELNETSAVRINDVYSKLAQNTASNVQEISTAMTKVAALANSANMSFENTAAFLAKIIESTREGAETAGTALKTVIARFTEVKKLYSEGELTGTDEEGQEVDVNKISAALRTAGIDMNAFFTGAKGLDEIFIELGSKWDSLTTVQQRYIATMAAGSRQQSRFLALMQDFNRTTELTGMAYNSAGSGQEQFEKTLESLESKLNKLKDAWQTFIMGIANSDVVKGLIDTGTKILETINNIINSLSGKNGLIKSILSVAAAVGVFKTGSSLVKMLLGSGINKSLSGGLLSKIFGSKGEEAGDNFIKNFQKSIQKNISSGKDFGAKTGIGAWFKGTFRTQDTKAIKKATENLFVDTNATDEQKNSILNNLQNGNVEEANKGLQNLGKDAEEAEKRTKSFNDAMTKSKANVQAFGTAAMTAGGLLFGLGSILEKTSGVGKTFGKVIKSVGIALLVFGGTLKILGVAINTFSKEATASISSIPIIGWIAAVIAAISALVIALASLGVFGESTADKIKRLEDSAAQLSDKVNDLRSDFESLQSAVEKIKDQENTFSNLIVGTIEYDEAVKNLNQSILDLIRSYPELADTVEYVNGKFVLNDEKYQKYLKQKEQELDNVELLATATNAVAKETIANNNKAGFWDELVTGTGFQTDRRKREYALSEDPSDFFSDTSSTTGNYIKGSVGLVLPGTPVGFITDRRRKGWGTAVEGVLSTFGVLGAVQNAVELIANEGTDANARLADELRDEFNVIFKTIREGKFVLVNSDDEKIEQIETFLRETEGYENAIYTNDQLRNLVGALNVLTPALDDIQDAEFKAKEANEELNFLNISKIFPKTKASKTDYSNDFLQLAKVLINDIVINEDEITNKMQQKGFTKGDIAKQSGLKADDITNEGYRNFIINTLTQEKLGKNLDNIYSDFTQKLTKEQQEIFSKVVVEKEEKAFSKFTLEELEDNSFLSSLTEIQSKLNISKQDFNKLIGVSEEENINEVIKNLTTTFKENLHITDGLYEQITGLSNSLTLDQITSMVDQFIGISSRGGEFNSYLKIVQDLLDNNENKEKEILEVLSKIDLSDADQIRELPTLFKNLGIEIDNSFIPSIIEATEAVSNFSAKKIEEQITSLEKARTAAFKISEGERTINQKEYDAFKLISPDFKTTEWERTGWDEYTYIGEETNSILSNIDTAVSTLVTNTIKQTKEDVGKGREIKEQIDNGKTINVNGEEIDVLKYLNRLQEQKKSKFDIINFGKNIIAGEKITTAFNNSIERGYDVEGIEKLAELFKIDISNIDTSTDEGLEKARQIVLDYYNKYYGTEGESLKTNEEKLGVLEEYSRILPYEYTTAQEVINDKNLEQDKKTKVLNTSFLKLDAGEQYMTNQDIEKYGEKYSNVLKGLAIDSIQTAKKFDNLTKAYKDNADALKKENEGTREYGLALGNLTKATKAAFGNNENITEEFVERHLNLFKDYANGVEGADEKIRQVMLDEGVISGDTDQLNQLKATIDSIDGEELTINGTADCTQAFSELAALYGSAKTAADKMEELGYTVTWEPDGETTMRMPNGKLETIPNYRAVVRDSAGKVLDDNKDKGKGGGGGKKFKNDFDKYYNQVEDINELIRLRNLLETDYNQLLKAEGTSGKQIYDNLKKQINLLKERQKLTADLAEKRKGQIFDLLNDEEYKDVRQYAWWNEEDQTIEIDWDAINKIKDSKTGDKVKELVQKLEDLQSKYDEQIEALEEIEDALEDIRKRGRDEYISLEERLQNALIAKIQEQIDELSATNEAINTANSNLMDSIQKALDQQRQERENTKTEEELADKEQRLAYLQQDSSGANQVEIAQLQKELDEAREDYTDQLIDQKISELQEQNDEAAQQRQEQIDLMQQSLDWQEKNGEFWEQAYQILEQSIGPDGSLLKGSELEQLLKSSEGWQGLSDAAKMKWLEELETQVAQAVGYLSLSRQLEDIGTKAGSQITFTNAEGQTLTGKVDKNGNVVVTNADGSTTTYKDVYQSYDGTYHTFETEEDAKKENESATNTKSPSKPRKPNNNDDGNQLDGHGWHSDEIGHWHETKNGTVVDYGVHAWDQVGTPEAMAGKTVTCNWCKRKKTYPKNNGSSGTSGGGGGSKPNVVMAYATGGLNTQTGPAWLDGTKSHPELVLNARDTENFIQLKDHLAILRQMSTNGLVGAGGDNYYDIDVHVDEIGSDYDVDRLADRLKTLIYKDGQYRNVNVLNRLR